MEYLDSSFVAMSIGTPIDRESGDSYIISLKDVYTKKFNASEASAMEYATNIVRIHGKRLKNKNINLIALAYHLKIKGKTDPAKLREALNEKVYRNFLQSQSITLVPDDKYIISLYRYIRFIMS